MNTCANLFHSESELRAALGCAANLDRNKHPRRWEQAQAKKLVANAARANSAEQIAQAQALIDPRYQAQSQAHSRRRREKAEYIEANKHLTHQQLAEQTGWAIRTIKRICTEYGISCARARRESRHDQ